MNENTTRGGLCDEAKKIITQDRNNQYGEPEDVFEIIAKNWTWWLRARGKLMHGEVVAAYDVAQMMVGFKQARSAGNPSYRDGALDQIGYSAIAGELSVAKDVVKKSAPVGEKTLAEVRKRL